MYGSGGGREWGTRAEAVNRGTIGVRYLLTGDAR